MLERIVPKPDKGAYMTVLNARLVKAVPLGEPIIMQAELMDEVDPHEMFETAQGHCMGVGEPLYFMVGSERTCMTHSWYPIQFYGAA